MLKAYLCILSHDNVVKLNMRPGFPTNGSVSPMGLESFYVSDPDLDETVNNLPTQQRNTQLCKFLFFVPR